MKNLSLIVVAVITLVFASCSKPVNNNPGGNTVVETKTDLISSGTWKMQELNNGVVIVDDKITFNANGSGYRTTKMLIGGSNELKQYNFSWSFTNNQNDVNITQKLVKLNGSTNIDPIDAAPELRKYRIISLSSSNLNMKKYFVDGVSLSNYTDAYTK